MNNLRLLAACGKQTHFDYRNFLRFNPRILDIIGNKKLSAKQHEEITKERKNSAVV
jgi:hypothetical protein